MFLFSSVKYIVVEEKKSSALPIYFIGSKVAFFLRLEIFLMWLSVSLISLSNSLNCCNIARAASVSAEAATIRTPWLLASATSHLVVLQWFSLRFSLLHHLIAVAKR